MLYARLTARSQRKPTCSTGYFQHCTVPISRIYMSVCASTDSSHLSFCASVVLHRCLTLASRSPGSQFTYFPGTNEKILTCRKRWSEHRPKKKKFLFLLWLHSSYVTIALCYICVLKHCPSKRITVLFGNTVPQPAHVCRRGVLVGIVVYIAVPQLFRPEVWREDTQVITLAQKSLSAARKACQQLGKHVSS
jgi:hypothetical protein